MTSKDRMEILERLERGEISPDEAARMLESGTPARKSPKTPMDVLEQLERGEISADEAAKLLRRGPRPNPRPRRVFTQMEIIDHDHPRHKRPRSMPEFDKYRRWWLVPLVIGILITGLAGMWMASILQSRGLGLLFLCSWAPLSLGILLIILGWASQFSTWLHVRVHPNKPGAPGHIAVSTPLPLGLASWFMRWFGVRIEGLDADAVDEILAALEQSGKHGEPFYVEVDNTDTSGEYVEVFIG